MGGKSSSLTSGYRASTGDVPDPDTTDGAGVAPEIDALRSVLARLMSVEHEADIDPIKLAGGVARVASVTIQAMRTQRTIQRERPAAAPTDPLDRLIAGIEDNPIEGGRGEMDD